MAKLNLIGNNFGKLIVIKENGRSSGKQVLWLCLCECVNEKTIRGDALTLGKAKSCGCLQKELASKRFKTHGQSGKKSTPEYKAWQHIRDRCCNSNDKRYYDYGARGITICDRWRYSFENFFSDMGNRPTNNHSIDRFPDPNGNYEPSNCRWALPKQQSSNLRNNVFVLYKGEKMVISELARRLKKYDYIVRRQVYKNKIEGVILLGKLNAIDNICNRMV